MKREEALRTDLRGLAGEIAGRVAFVLPVTDLFVGVPEKTA
jgi:hypothetical protein